MPRKKMSEEERKEQKRVAERIRMEKIKNNPELHVMWKEKQREKYLKKKRRGKIVPIREMTPKNQKVARAKSRENSKRCYYKKKMKNSAVSQSETQISLNLEHEPNDPSNLASTSSAQTKQDSTTLLQKDLSQSCRTEKSFAKSPVSLKSNSTARITRSTAKLQQNHHENDVDLTERETVIDNRNKIPLRTPRSPSPITSTINSPRPFSPCRNILNNSPIMSICESQRSSPSRFSDLYTTASPMSLSPQSSASLNSSPTSSKKSARVAKTEKSIKKKSPWKHLIRRLKYRSNKELQLKDKKIQELKLVNERYRKCLKRLQKDKVVRNIVSINRQEQIETQTETLPSEAEKSTEKIRNDVRRFLEDDENSRICPGKKEFITLKKVKKQKRYLTDSLQNLHKKFVESCDPQARISYSCFCKLRPFWTIVPNVQIRDTCLCKDHENMELAVAALRKNYLISEKSTSQVLQSLCCDPKNVLCLTRNCDSCKNRDLQYKEFDNSIESHYWIWNKVKKNYIKDGIEKTTVQTAKQKVTAYPKEIIDHFQKLLRPFMHHCGNITNQYNYIKKIKTNLRPEQCIIHCDFSENYNTKYASEIQSFHFGSSRQQITLHTTVIYYLKNGELCKQSFGTLSECLRHDAVAVWEHLMPLLKFLENEVPEITTIHFVSDSPSAQYRNRKMFYIMAKLHWNFPSLRLVVWNYTEKGHGKGAPDGVGGTLKRTADQIVARGNDISNIDSLLKHLRDNVSGVKLEVVDESGIREKDLLIPTNLKEFRGTMSIHQVVWSADKWDTLAMRQLSCALDNCSEEAIKCLHGQHIGFYCIGDIDSRDNSKANQKLPTTKRTTAMKAPPNSSLIKRSKTNQTFEATKFEPGNDTHRTLQNLALPNIVSRDNTMANKKVSTTKLTTTIKAPPRRSLIKCSKIKHSFEAAKFESGNDTDRTHQNLDVPTDDSFWMEVSSIDEKIVTPKLTKAVLSSLYQKGIGGLSDSNDSNDENICSYKKPYARRLTKPLDSDDEDIFDLVPRKKPHSLERNNVPKLNDGDLLGLGSSKKPYRQTNLFDSDDEDII